MKTLAERLAWARKEKGIRDGRDYPQQALADAAGVSQSTIGNLESGIRLTARKIAEIAKVLAVDTLWLSEGKGSPTRNLQFDTNVKLSSIGLRKVPVISSIQAGLLSEITDPYAIGDGFDVMYTDDDSLSQWAFGLEIEGDSMLPEFTAGDRVIIDPDVVPRPGDYVAARNGEQHATFKKYRPRGSDGSGNAVFELVPLNDDYPTLRSDSDNMMVIGTMVEHRKYRRYRK